jgi:rsbT co-antagonist protein RsbR
MKLLSRLPTQRARTLFITAAILAAGTLADLPLLISGKSPGVLVPIAVTVLLLALSVMWLAYRGTTLPGGTILSLMLFAAIAFVTINQGIVHSVLSAAFLIPILIAGLVLGSRAVLVFGFMTIVTFAISIAASVAEFKDISWITIIIIISTGLLWLTINLLEGNLRESESQQKIAQLAETKSTATAISLQETLNDLQQKAEEVTRLYQTVSNLEISVIPLIDGVIVAPLVGHLDTSRMERLTQRVLETVRNYRVKLVLIDITGVLVFDTAVAQRLASLGTAVHLLGAEMFLTGITAETAITITSLAISFDNIRTFGRLQQGVETALASVVGRN